nr:hypothetical protein [Tanacetum cinerariifolium]
MSARIAKEATLSPSSFHKRYRSFYETSSSSSPTLSVRKRYRGTSKLILDHDSEGDELEEKDTEEDKSSDVDDERESRRYALELTEEIAPSTYEVGQSSRVYIDILTYAPPAAPVQTPSSPEWSLGSLPVSPSSLVVSSPIDSLVATLTATISVDEDQFLERAALWHAIYDIQRENYDLRRQLTEERRERLELTDHVARMERRQESRGE